MNLIDQYIQQADWRIKENANQSYSYPGLIGYTVSAETAKYALENIYPAEAAEAHTKGFVHIHDLSGLCCYCLGLDLEMFLTMGLRSEDGPPRHFSSALSQMTNAIYLVSQQIAGAVAFNSVDILLAAYIKKDGLAYKEVKQIMQEFVYSNNIPGRVGFQSPFLNFQLDITIPSRLKYGKCVIAGEVMDFNYEDCRTQIEWFSRALLEVMMESKRPLPFPVINVGVTREFGWESKLAETIFTGIGRIGQPTLNNYYNSNYDPDSVKSMCCSLRLDMRKIIKQAGGQFGAADNSGSLGVGTMNMARFGYLSDGSKDILHGYIDMYMDFIVKAIVSKRRFVEKMHKKGMYPTLKRFIGKDYRSFFNTIGIIALHEMCLNFWHNKGWGIESKKGMALTLEVLDYMNEKIGDYQEEYKDFYGPGKGLLFNLELVPGEGVMYRFAKSDKEQYPDIITQVGDDGTPYYTRGCWLPADQEYSLAFATKHQEVLQDKFSGGANFNHYINEPIHDWKAVRSLVRRLITKTKLPFISISPTLTVCPICGVIQTTQEYCEHSLTDEQIEELKERGVELIEDARGSFLP